MTQRETCFYLLYKQHKQDPQVYINVFDLMGETYCKELGIYGFVSHECSARMSKLFDENKNRRTMERLFERKYMHGRSGSKWYAYRLNLHPSKDLIISDDLVSFYAALKANQQRYDENTTQAPDGDGEGPVLPPVLPNGQREEDGEPLRPGEDRVAP